ncbi:DUF3761 domain-containing protein [Tardiphaga sp.]|uniref:DUF3761 domain-containing protein n=1 Tax=Tardiphaga sp. TaxID=1926292 RepID=UPI00352A1C30
MIALGLACLLLAGGTVEARENRHHHHVVTSGYGEDYYTARSGHRVHRPMQASRAPAGASAQCADRSWSFSESRRGTCSHHGGVSRWL